MGETAMQTLDTPYEIGFHLVVIMDRWYPSFLTRGKLWLLESLLVYAAVPDSMKSVSNAFLISTVLNRRELIEASLRLLIRKGIVASKLTESGILYRLGGNAVQILASFDKNYINRFEIIADRLHAEFDTCSAHDLFQIVTQRAVVARRSLSVPFFTKEDENGIHPVN